MDAIDTYEVSTVGLQFAYYISDCNNPRHRQLLDKYIKEELQKLLINVERKYRDIVEEKAPSNLITKQ